jgi:hypothetical protein
MWLFTNAKQRRAPAYHLLLYRPPCLRKVKDSMIGIDYTRISKPCMILLSGWSSRCLQWHKSGLQSGGGTNPSRELEILKHDKNLGATCISVPHCQFWGIRPRPPPLDLRPWVFVLQYLSLHSNALFTGSQFQMEHRA